MSEPSPTSSVGDIPQAPRRPVDLTGVSGLDEVLGGGLPRGALTIITGPPGSGKTILASQLAFAAARAGRSAIIATALSEPPGKLMEHLGDFSFFDASQIGGAVQVLSLQRSLASGLEAVVDEIVALTRQAQAGVVVIDGFSGVRGEDGDMQEARRFLYRLAGTLGTLGTSLIVTNEALPRDPSQFPEATTADVIIGLYCTLAGRRHRRSLEVLKLRGAAPLAGLHSLTLGPTGMIVYPRLESRMLLEGNGARGRLMEPGIEDAPEELPAVGSTDAESGPATFGLPELDTLLEGGLTHGTSTVLAGSLGTGKTLLALQFALAGVHAGESVVFMGFRESARQLATKADTFALGPELRAALRPGGGLTLLRWDPIDLNPDILADRLLKALDATRARRLVVDSVIELERAVIESSDRDRVDGYMAALVKAVRTRGVSALFLRETRQVLTQGIEFNADELSVLAENVLLQQQVSYRAQLHRVLSVIKMRFSAHDVTLREYTIAPPSGIHVLTPFESGADILAGIAGQQEEGRTMRSTAEPPAGSPREPGSRQEPGDGGS